ncbi:MAG: tail fiber protein [Flavobacteriaceae bacterium]|nr:tail fiber protein [Flavobacteriaceae bacterium]
MLIPNDDDSDGDIIGKVLTTDGDDNYTWENPDKGNFKFDGSVEMTGNIDFEEDDVNNAKKTVDGVDVSALKELVDNMMLNLDPIGVSKLWSGTLENIPAGYLPEDGSSLLRTEYPDLFIVIGDIYGSVDDSHFNLPDSRGRTVMGIDNVDDTDVPDPIVIGTSGGNRKIQIEKNQMPSHNHTNVGASGGTPGGTIAVANKWNNSDMIPYSSGWLYRALNAYGGDHWVPTPTGTTSGATLRHNHTATFTGNPLGNHNHGMQNTGGTDAIDITPSYISKYYIIKAKKVVAPTE